MNNEQRSCIIKIALGTNPFLELNTDPKVFSSEVAKAFVNHIERKRFKATPLKPDDTATNEDTLWSHKIP